VNRRACIVADSAVAWAIDRTGRTIGIGHWSAGLKPVDAILNADIEKSRTMVRILGGSGNAISGIDRRTSQKSGKKL
jgi:hypothetical protein